MTYWLPLSMLGYLKLLAVAVHFMRLVCCGLHVMWNHTVVVFSRTQNQC